MRKIWIIALLFTLIFPLSGENVTLPENTLIFPELNGYHTAGEPLKSSLVIVPEAIESGFISLQPQTPLMRKQQFYRFSLPDGSIAYAHPGLSSATRPDTPTAYASVFNCEKIVLLLLTILIVIFYRLCKAGKISFDSAWSMAFIFAALMLFRQFLALSAIGWTGNFLCAPADDPGYLKGALALLEWNFKEPLHFTIGQGIFYLPFLVIMKTRDYFDFVEVYSYFSALILSPAAIGLQFLFFKKLSNSVKISLAAAIILAAYPFIFHWMLTDTANVTTSLFGVAGIGGTFTNYNTFIAIGFNTMSDTTALFLITLLLVLAAYLPGKWYSAMIIGVLFGFACMVRINNIFYAPVIGFLYCMRQEAWLTRRAIARYCVGVVAAVMFFAPQLLLNYIQFGGIFHFPYELHPNRAAEGFSLEFFRINVNYLFGANSIWWSVGAASLLFLRDRWLRGVLVLWSLPVMFFFFGYPCTTYDAVRFILPVYGAFIMAFASLDLWRKFNRMRLIMYVLLIAIIYFSGGIVGVCALILSVLVSCGDIWRYLRGKC